MHSQWYNERLKKAAFLTQWKLYEFITVGNKDCWERDLQVQRDEPNVIIIQFVLVKGTLMQIWKPPYLF